MSPKAQEKSVLQQERESVSHLAIAAVVIDQKGTIQAFNSAAEKVWGFTVCSVAVCVHVRADEAECVSCDRGSRHDALVYACQKKDVLVKF